MPALRTVSSTSSKLAGNSFRPRIVERQHIVQASKVGAKNEIVINPFAGSNQQTFFYDDLENVEESAKRNQRKKFGVQQHRTPRPDRREIYN